ncbi:MAG: MarR family winged helix-turn-helix transcriptional regulator [Eubacteriales bacterium]|nr:MarR family winged helix-turn-helix transcriptional regulator [Eubacteriales bacterium]
MIPILSTNQIGSHIHIASHLIRRSLDAQLSALNLTGLQARVLEMIGDSQNRGQDIFQRDIEQTFRIRRSSVTSVISNLETSGYVQRCSVQNDARLKKLTLTEKGWEARQSFFDILNDFEQTLQSEFTEAEYKKLLEMLVRIETKLCDCREKK